ncbi:MULTISPECIES: hypothetical protein [unclassified Synechococcus]|uniref:hypothetical protein n=1 Tax=unclassified Synechococcus TaxID=2626047 RepID=UPI00006999C1|nr:MULTISPECIES: hypothetical protein [unclassified Synechococcus]MDM7937243.1 hypothetical protein [Cyanobium sp. CZS48M]EAQ76537.1 hypothetical protein WH5701_04680 [Synechococcus sp. WH 5701]MCP9823974.1 hypothetical protein [Synechococcus sp. EJ6-Ellesmere]WFN59276.1 hypothetical protein N4320_01215 [Synechococcus sp. CCFWC 502]CAK6694375.1 hypothetical protein ICNINCKA_01610 [Synechococcus sp. CBW1107]
MNDPLSLSREFSTAVHSRAIDNCNDIEELRQVAQTLLRAWQMQAAFTADYGAKLLNIKPR